MSTWTPEKVNTLLASMGLPYAYYQFPEGTGQEPPFLCFFYPEDSDFYADDKPCIRERRIALELYTNEKDFTLEARVEDALAQNGLAFTREETYLASERMYMVSYEMTALFDAPGGDDTDGETPATEGESDNG